MNKNLHAFGEKVADMTGALNLGSNTAVAGGLLGGGLGAAGGLVSGAYAAPRGKKLRGALGGLLRGAGKGALLGGGAGLGLGAALGSYVPWQEILDAARAGKPIGEEGLKARMQGINPAEAAGVTTLSTLGGAGLGGLLGSALIGDGTKKKKDDALETDEKIAARQFGAKLANAMLQGGLGGAALGAGLGGLAGAFAPGEEETIDDEGRLVKRPKSRLMGALKGALGGGALGGAAGAGLGHLQPDLVARGTQLYNRHTPVPTAAVANARAAMNNAGEEPFYDSALGDNPAMAAARG